MEEFQGFRIDVFDLWCEICSGNETNSEVIKEKYKTYITKPLIQLYDKLLPSLQMISDDFDMTPSKCISSPYTDMRFSKGKKYKDYLYLRFKQWGKEHDICGLYFDMGSEFYSYGFRIYKQTNGGIQIAKEKIVHHIDYFSKLMASVMEQGFEFYGESYKKDHFPDLEDSAVKKILNKKNFYIGKRVKLNQNVFSAELAEEIMDGFFCVSEIYQFLKT